MKALIRLEGFILIISFLFLSNVIANLSIKSLSTVGILPEPSNQNFGKESASARSSGWNDDLAEQVLVLGAPVLFLPALLLALLYLIWAGSYSSYNYHHKYPYGFSYTGIGTIGHGGYPQMSAHSRGYPQRQPSFSKRISPLQEDSKVVQMLTSI